MAYSSEEIQAAVEKMVRSTVRRTLDTSGVRQVQIQFDDVREVVAGVFILYPNSPYYLIMLGLDRLHLMTKLLTSSLDSFVTVIEATGRRVEPIKDLSSLSDAQVALLQLESALWLRSGALKEPTTLPAYQQWNAAAAKYINTIGRSVKEGGGGLTPNQAKNELSTMFTQLMEDYAACLEYQRYLQLAAANYASLQLPAAIAQNVVAKARGLLASDAQDLNALSAEARLEVAKDKTLNAVAAQSIVNAYVNGQKITGAMGLTGLVIPYSDDSHLGTVATVVGDLPGPYALVSYPVAKAADPDVRDNNVLTFTAQGVTAKIILPVSFCCFLVGNGKPQPQPAYDPSNPNPTVNPSDPNITYTFYADGIEKGPDSAYRDWKIDHEVGGSARFPPLLMAQGAGTSPSGPHYCENFTNDPDKVSQWFFPPANDTLYIEQLIEGGATTRYEIHLVNKLTDAATTFEYPSPGMAPPYPDCQDWTAYKVKLTLQQVIDRINTVLSLQGSYLRATLSGTGGIQIGGSIPLPGGGNDPTELVVNRVVGIRIPQVVVATVETNTAAQNPLGFVLGLEMWSRRSSAMSIITYVNGNTSKVTGLLVAYPESPLLTNMVAWTNMANKAGVILAKYTGVGAVTVSGMTITLTISSVFETFETYGVIAGDIIYLPKQYVMNNSIFEEMGDKGAKYVVTSVNHWTLHATHVSGAAAEVYPQRMFDVGLPIAATAVTTHHVVQVATTPNDGAYEISSIDPYSPFRVYFDLLLSQSQQNNEALPLQLEVTVGPASCSFSSVNETVASSISVAGSCRPLIFSTAQNARGTTPYIQISTDLKVTATDRIVLRDALIQTRQVKNVEGRVLTLDQAVSSAGTWTAGAAALPNAELISGAKTNVDNKTLELEAWTKVAPADATLYEQNMNAKLNPLLVNHVPAAGRIADAKAGVAILQSKVEGLGVLSEVQLTGPVPNATPTSFYVEPIPAVDDMLSTLKGKGCDRAIDLLLMGRFSEFFGLDMDEMTYIGAMMKAARDVARNDLTVSRFGASKIRRKVLSIVEGTDPDYDHSDSDNAPSAPDATSGFDLPSTPDAT